MSSYDYRVSIVFDDTAQCRQVRVAVITRGTGYKGRSDIIPSSCWQRALISHLLRTQRDRDLRLIHISSIPMYTMGDFAVRALQN